MKLSSLSLALDRIVGVGGGGNDLLYYDHFDGTNNTPIVDHIPDIGGSWTQVANTFKIYNSQVFPLTASYNSGAMLQEAGIHDTLKLESEQIAARYPSNYFDVVRMDFDGVQFTGWGAQYSTNGTTVAYLAIVQILANNNRQTKLSQAVPVQTFPCKIVFTVDDNLFTAALPDGTSIQYEDATEFNRNATKVGIVITGTTSLDWVKGYG